MVTNDDNDDDGFSIVMITFPIGNHQSQLCYHEH